MCSVTRHQGLPSLSLSISHIICQAHSSSAPALHNVQSAFLIILPLANERLLSSHTSCQAAFTAAGYAEGSGTQDWKRKVQTKGNLVN